jgi:hypothetical protein
MTRSQLRTAVGILPTVLGVNISGPLPIDCRALSGYISVCLYLIYVIRSFFLGTRTRLSQLSDYVGMSAEENPSPDIYMTSYISLKLPGSVTILRPRI